MAFTVTLFECILCFWLAEEARVLIPSSDSSGAKNVTTGLEDSGVEVGQESEQENAPGRAVKSAIGGSDSAKSCQMKSKSNRQSH